ncbi:MAG: hypothetical protein OSA45_07830 [Halioglobus sp.]|nr:hypothetical protein [Halioglobus sp.]
MSNKETAKTFFTNLWVDPELARSVATDDVTWITTRSMPIPGAEGTEHVGWDAVMNVATSGLKISTGYIPETMEQTNVRWLETEEDCVVYQFTMECQTKAGKEYINDYLFLVELRGGKVARFQEYWDSKQAFELLLG